MAAAPGAEDGTYMVEFESDQTKYSTILPIKISGEGARDCTVVPKSDTTDKQPHPIVGPKVAERWRYRPSLALSDPRPLAQLGLTPSAVSALTDYSGVSDVSKLKGMPMVRWVTIRDSFYIFSVRACFRTTSLAHRSSLCHR